jgi:hypothetical protein
MAHRVQPDAAALRPVHAPGAGDSRSVAPIVG